MCVSVFVVYNRDCIFCSLCITNLCSCRDAAVLTVLHRVRVLSARRLHTMDLHSDERVQGLPTPGDGQVGGTDDLQEDRAKGQPRRDTGRRDVLKRGKMSTQSQGWRTRQGRGME